MKKTTEIFINNCINEYIHGVISINDVMDKAYDKVAGDIYLDVLNDIAVNEIKKLLSDNLNKDEVYFLNFLDDFIKNYDKYKLENAMRSIV